ncbi:uncharacterized protein LOC135495492 [Lineus longissimus]|uniref:uncharacterized protein LOC135495492 n=1 Tax=Lineus longissimus TaxID=88925 RepID=UPI002B4CEC7D
MRRSSNLDGVEKAGYVDVKFPGKIKGMRGWCRRWVVIVKLRVECSGRRCVAKVDIFLDEDSWRKGKHADRRIMENVSIIKRTPSSTHAHAFHVDGDEPLSMAGRSETESQDWMRVLRAIFLPKMRKTYDDAMFEVSVIDNCSSAKIGLNADYLMSIEATHIHLIPTNEQQKFYQWGFCEIPFFNLTPGVPAADKEKILSITLSPSGEQGEEFYNFYSLNARELIEMIRTHLHAMSESPYSHIEHQPDEEEVTSLDGDRDYKYDHLRRMGPCVPNASAGQSHQTLKRSPAICPAARSHMSPMLPVPAIRPSKLKLVNTQDRPTVNDPDASNTASRDSGITSPTCETHPDNARESTCKVHHDWKHHDSVDSGTTDLDIEDQDYDDISLFQLDSLGIIGTQSNSREEVTTLSTFTRNRIQSEPDLKRYGNSSKRMAMSAPDRRPSLPQERINNDMETGHDPFNKTWPESISTSDNMNELAWRENQSFHIESPVDPSFHLQSSDDPTFPIESPEESDENIYVFHNNAEYLQKCKERISYLSDISESERSRQGSISLTEPRERECTKNPDSEEPFSSVASSACVSDESSGYLDMSGRTFSKVGALTMQSADRGAPTLRVEAETECTYVMMTRPKPRYENVPLFNV